MKGMCGKERPRVVDAARTPEGWEVMGLEPCLWPGKEEALGEESQPDGAEGSSPERAQVFSLELKAGSLIRRKGLWVSLWI